MSQSSLTSLAHVAKRYSVGQSPEWIDLNQLEQPVKKDSLVWVSLIDPSDDELLAILPHFIGQQSRVIDEVITKHRRPKVVEYDGVSLIVAISFKTSHGGVHFGEMQVLFGADFLISIWRHPSAADHVIREDLEAKTELLMRGADFVVAELLNTITDSYTEQLFTLEHQVEKVESHFFGGRFSA